MDERPMSCLGWLKGKIGLTKFFSFKGCNVITLFHFGQFDGGFHIYCFWFFRLGEALLGGIRYI